jgi:hypothetical protein
MSQALLANPQGVLHKRHLVYCVCIKYVVARLQFHGQLTLYARKIPNAVCVAPPKNEQVMLKTCTGP